jgi:2-polyprenyl-6-hydroxyphenyl methylase/3-demethylubiquinone-9 3-methyltransferase
MNQLMIQTETTLRFAFGTNWSKFLSDLNGERIRIAERSLQDILAVQDLNNKAFLDVGCGSGLFSLAARRLGARVYSFDRDIQSIACAHQLKGQYYPLDTKWTIAAGSVLDTEFLRSLGTFDIVYSWGVLHHTGAMWAALENICLLLKPGGKLVLAIYNDQGRVSRYWMCIKRTYNLLPLGLRWIVLWPTLMRLWGPTLLRDTLSGKSFRTWKEYAKTRGMSPWRDVVDWVGGYPFEVAKPEDVFEFYHRNGLKMIRLKTCGGGHGCNEFVFLHDIHRPRGQMHE